MYDVTVFNAEPPELQPLLSPVLAGEMKVQDIILNDHDWYRDNRVNLHLGKRLPGSTA